MIKRNKTSEQLSAYLDGELSPAEAAALETALANEPALARELDGLRATRALVRRLPREHAPDDFARRVVARLERRSLLEPGLHEAPSPSRRWLWLAAAAAAVFLAAGVATYVALLMFPHGTPPVAHAPQSSTADQPIALAKAHEAPPRELFPVAAGGDGGEGPGRSAPGHAAAKAGGGPAPAKPGGPAAKQSESPEAETLYVPVNAGDLTLARRGLEQALFDMEIAPTTDEPAPTASPGRPGNLVYRTVGAAPGQVKYVVANVPRSQLPALVRKLEEFRHKQDLKQDSLESAQTRLAMVDTPTEPNSKQEINQAAWLGRGALLREVLAESERAKKPAATQAVEGTAGESIASAEPTGHAKNVKSNAEYTQKARDFQGGLRAGPGPYDEAGAAPKGLAPGGGPNPSAAAPAEEQMKKSAAGKGTGVVAPVDSVAKEAPAPPVVAKSDRAPVIPSPLPGVAPATRKSEDDKAAQFAAGAGAADRALVAKDKSVADRADLRVDNKADAGLELAKRQERTAITETPQTVAQAPATQPALAGKYEREQATPPQAAEKAAPDAHGEGRARDARRSGEAHYNLCIILNAPAPAPDAKVEPSDSQPMDDKDADPGQE